MKKVITLFIPLLSGLLFGAGLAVSGMNDPAKVQSFLDVFGLWDITLIFVMAAAIAVTMLTFTFILKRTTPILDSKFHLPTFLKVDNKLIVGSALFGAGWGIVGYCPGPAIAAISYGYWQTFVFIVSMFVGAYICNKTTS